MKAATNLVKGARKSFTLTDLVKQEKFAYSNLIEAIHIYPNHGVGFRIAKVHWPENQYIHVTKVDLESNRLGRVFGKIYKDGKLLSENLIDVDGTSTRGLWRYDLGDAFCQLDNGLTYTLQDLEKQFGKVRQRGWKRPESLRKNMKWTPPEEAANTTFNKNLLKQN
jgi:hypothetical protein